MELMPMLRRHIFFPFVTWLFLCAFLSIALSLAAYLSLENILLSLLAGALLFFVQASIVFWVMVHRPIKKIIREMKALLTGNSYRRILTNKRNEIGILAHFFNEVTRNLESISSNVKSHQRIIKELNTAQKIQRDLLPKNAPSIPGLDIVAKTRPASEIGGDTFDFYPLENRALMYIGDSTGHGIPAGIVMVMVDTLIETFIDMQESITDVMVHLNKYLKPHLQTTMFMTMILLEWNAAEHQMKWIGAGHEYLIHVQTQQGQVNAIKAGGIAVGMVPDNSALIKEENLTLAPNDFLILYSDGITEAKNVMGEIYGLERLKTFLQNHVTETSTAQDIFEKIAIDVGRFMEGHMQEDDMTLIVMKHSQEQSAEKSTAWSSASESQEVPLEASSEAPA